MYGYVVPDKARLKQEEFVLYAAFYCGMCKTLGKCFGQAARYTTNYDMTFFCALVFDILDYKVEFKKQNCVGNPFTKKLMVESNDLMIRIADINMITAYFSAQDNVKDGKRGAKAIRHFFKKPYHKAAEREPEIDLIVRRMYERLATEEAQGQTSPDIVADCFASMLRDCAVTILGEKADDNIRGLAYNIGKFVYLADALDDTGEDYSKKRYNPFLAAFGGYENRRQFIDDNHSELVFILAACVNRAIECFNGMKFNQSYSLLENIVYYGLRMKADELLKSDKKLKRPKI